VIVAITLVYVALGMLYLSPGHAGGGLRNST
jgi:hypothetical protein